MDAFMSSLIKHHSLLDCNYGSDFICFYINDDICSLLIGSRNDLKLLANQQYIEQS